MARDGTNRGGARAGAGRKSKAMADKIAEGNLGGRPLTVVSLADEAAELSGSDMPPVKDYMSARQKDGTRLLADEIYKDLWAWLKQYSCEKLVLPHVMEQFAMVSARLIHCEKAISEYGYLVKKANGSAATSPYVTMSNEYRKQANQLYYQIYQVVRENSTVEVGGLMSGGDPMEQLLRARKG